MTETESWISKEFLEQVLRHELHDEALSVESFESTKATAPGDNYASLMLRVSVTVNSGQTINLLTKTLPDTGEFFLKMISEANIFQREADMYYTVLPHIYRIMHKHFPRKDIRSFTARSFFTDRPNTIVLEDLKPLGFKMADRRKRLNLEHSELVIKNLAVFHALSIAIMEESPSLKEKLPEVIYRPERRDMLQMVQEPYMKALGKVVSSWPDYKSFGESIAQKGMTILDKVCELFDVKEDEFNVINLGDCWVNNFLFKYSKYGQLGEMRFVDLQLGRYASFAMELQYFFSTSINDLVWGLRPRLIELYHRELSSSLKLLDLQVKIPPLAKVREEYERKNVFGMMTTLGTLATILIEPHEAPDLSQLTTENLSNMSDSDLDGPMFAVYKGKKFGEVLRKRIIEYREKFLI